MNTSARCSARVSHAPSAPHTRAGRVNRVKYLGQSDARGLWGIKHTRKPVDLMVAAAKALPPEFEHMAVFFNIESISYGVQDLVYTRVFSMIIVKENADPSKTTPEGSRRCRPQATPATSHTTHNAARRLTYSLAAAFQDYSRRVKGMQTTGKPCYITYNTQCREKTDLLLSCSLPRLLPKGQGDADHRLTYSLAAAFQDYSRRVKEMQTTGNPCYITYNTLCREKTDLLLSCSLPRLLPKGQGDADHR
ncbi:hypothetical protein OBRU01_14358 [Operophtera brumata]|uniref:Uncharacterized protein n=1 Tax=Operophtera brumata TaxID=104452 RepID=A0A0L7L6P9_OPEBR|nr:hypothetical protein OBRU01_14358 [Operophtera brumata]